MKRAAKRAAQKALIIKRIVAGPTGLEPATSNVTGWRSNQTELRSRSVRFQISNLKSPIFKLVGTKGVEPLTSSFVRA